MAKNSALEEKVGTLASNKVETFIRRNENKPTTGRNVRPVIESWADELDRIANSTDRDSVDQEDISRLKKAENALRNLLKNRDDDLTYFIVNAPKKFWGTLRYIFDDTFTPRNYDPEPLTKYEIPKHANVVVGQRVPKEVPPAENIPRKKKPSNIHLNYDKPKFTLGGGAAQQQEQVKPKEEAEEKPEEKEEAVAFPGEVSDWIKRRQEQEVPEEVEVSQHKQEPDKTPLYDIWGHIADIAGQIKTAEEKSFNDLARSSIEKVLPVIKEQAEVILKALKDLQKADGVKQEAVVRVLKPLLAGFLNIDISRIMPSAAVGDFTSEMEDNVQMINEARKNISELSLLKSGIFSYSQHELNNIMADVNRDCNDLIDNSTQLLIAYTGLMDNRSQRIAKLSDIIQEHKEAFSSKSANGIKNRINPYLYEINPRVNLSTWKTRNIYDTIQSYLDNYVKTKSYKRVVLLINATKRLNRYVQQS